MLLYSIIIVSKVSIIRTLIKALSLIGLFLFEGGSAQFAGGFIISISSMVPGGRDPGAEGTGRKGTPYLDESLFHN